MKATGCCSRKTVCFGSALSLDGSRRLYNSEATKRYADKVNGEGKDLCTNEDKDKGEVLEQTRFGARLSEKVVAQKTSVRCRAREPMVTFLSESNPPCSALNQHGETSVIGQLLLSD